MSWYFTLLENQNSLVIYFSDQSSSKILQDSWKLPVQKWVLFCPIRSQWLWQNTWKQHFWKIRIPKSSIFLIRVLDKILQDSWKLPVQTWVQLFCPIRSLWLWQNTWKHTSKRQLQTSACFLKIILKFQFTKNYFTKPG